MIAELEITKHAARQWAKRTGERNPEVLRQTWDDEIATAVEIDLGPVGRTLALLNHEFADAAYFRSSNKWIFVVADGKVVTVHAGVAKRFSRAKVKA